jgi:putative restriction endonuclease
MSSGKKWTREELMIALNLYHKIPFSHFDQDKPVVIEVAKRMERKPGSLAMKLSNLASLDPSLKLRGIKGLTGASALDRIVWEEFHADLNETVPASEEAFRKLFGAKEGNDLEVLPKEGVRVRKAPPSSPTEATANVKLRRGQEYFRDAVLNNSGGRCGVTGIAVRELLIASHILPWGTHVSERLNVRNGLCLSRLHDAAFDRGLITFDDDLRLVLSPQLKAELPLPAVKHNFADYEKQPLYFPDDAVLPNSAFLAEHQVKVFRSKSR